MGGGTCRHATNRIAGFRVPEQGLMCEPTSELNTGQKAQLPLFPTVVVKNKGQHYDTAELAIQHNYIPAPLNIHSSWREVLYIWIQSM